MARACFDVATVCHLCSPPFVMNMGLSPADPHPWVASILTPPLRTEVDSTDDTIDTKEADTMACEVVDSLPFAIPDITGQSCGCGFVDWKYSQSLSFPNLPLAIKIIAFCNVCSNKKKKRGKKYSQSFQCKSHKPCLDNHRGLCC